MQFFMKMRFKANFCYADILVPFKKHTFLPFTFEKLTQSIFPCCVFLGSIQLVMTLYAYLLWRLLVIRHEIYYGIKPHKREEKLVKLHSQG